MSNCFGNFSYVAIKMCVNVCPVISLLMYYAVFCVPSYDRQIYFIDKQKSKDNNDSIDVYVNNFVL